MHPGLYLRSQKRSRGDFFGPAPDLRSQDDRVEPKPRRVKIQLDDDDNDDDGDGDGDENGPGRNILGRTPPTASVEEGLTDEKAPLHNVSNATSNAARDHGHDDEKTTDTPAPNRPEYQTPVMAAVTVLQRREGFAYNFHSEWSPRRR
ncbi:unnamed protein product [Ectocarpus sp. CCAP 1310/34]|nr:unnamed protein product [Ectocarpus sp. CCAP 1310/34]